MGWVYIYFKYFEPLKYLMNVSGGTQTISERTKALKLLLKDPFVAFLAAWQTGKRGDFLRVERQRRGLPRRKRRQAVRYTDADRMYFCRILAASCTGENWAEINRWGVTAKEGLDEFLVTVADLILSWIRHQQKDDAVIRWFDANEFGLAKKMQAAQRASVMWLERPNSLFLDGISRPKLYVVRKFDGQKDFRHAARTAAYSLWGTFLSEDPFSITFCPRCLKPLRRTRSDKVFCGDDCSKGESSNRSIKNRYRKENWEKLQKVSGDLHRKLSSGRSKDPLAGLASGRWLTRFIRVAEHTDDLEAEDRLLELCTEYGCAKEHRWEVRRVFDQFLKDIRKAKS